MSPPLPLLFTLPPSARHEFLLLDTTSSEITLKSLNRQILELVESSPNCAEFMAQHKKKASDSSSSATIQELKIHWDLKRRDAKIWPEFTVLTEGNLGAVLVVLGRDPGLGVLEVGLG
ncbi:hypothetical protein BDW02DRAFT_534218, partial [Decorospora gaudefroyi]